MTSKIKRDFKRLVVISDLHCGHHTGLTHPDFDSIPSTRSEFYKLYKKRRIHWNLFASEIDELRPIDYLVLNGDAIDGRGDKSGGVELLTTNRKTQAEMASQVVKFIGAPVVRITHGTDYHTGYSEDFEDDISKEVGGKISDTIDLDIGGLKINFKHHIGGSQSPLGRATPLIRERLWNLLWSQHGEFSKSDVIVRSHVHYHVAVKEHGWLAMITPGLQGYGTRFGKRRMSGTIDFGFVYFDIASKSRWTWESVIWKRAEFGNLAEKL